MSPLRLALAGLGGYLAGTFPSADLAARLAGGGVSLRSAGSTNQGAANAAQVLGPSWGAAVLAADVAKGAGAAALGRRLAGPSGAHLGAVAAVVGHCYPVWSGWRGGKGVAASAGQCLATFPAYFPIDLGVAYATARWRQRAWEATACSSACWVAAGLWWWRKGWPNAWGPPAGPDLPLAAAATSAVILLRFAQGGGRGTRGWATVTGASGGPGPGDRR
ncbi:MAG: glycerol-3-phosphate acyltransferase, partial [Acidimicrobiales bacterium]